MSDGVHGLPFALLATLTLSRMENLCSMLATKLWWVSMTPFGKPVVPEEKGSIQTSLWTSISTPMSSFESAASRSSTMIRSLPPGLSVTSTFTAKTTNSANWKWNLPFPSRNICLTEDVCCSWIAVFNFGSCSWVVMAYEAFERSSLKRIVMHFYGFYNVFPRRPQPVWQAQNEYMLDSGVSK